MHEVIFEAETPSGKFFDVLLLWAIVLSVAVVMLESIESVKQAYGGYLRVAEWVFTALFTIEYTLRLLSVRQPMKYATSFFGVVDLLAIVPTYISYFVVGAQSLLVIRVLRLLRIFRVLKLVQFVTESRVLIRALHASREKIIVFLGGVICLVLIIGSLMYLVEGQENGFSSIPMGVYWAIVTLTTVGFGDITPSTPLGQFLSSVVMIMGYAILAVPTGIISVELAQAEHQMHNTIACPACSVEGHSIKAKHCYRCGALL